MSSLRSGVRAAAIAAFRFGSAVAFVVVLPVLYLIEPFRKFRIGVLREDRIGHMINTTDIFLRRRRRDGVPRGMRTIFISGRPANRYVVDMYARYVTIVKSRALRQAYQGFAPILKKTRFFQPLPDDINQHFEWSELLPVLEFTAEEEATGQAALRAMGIGPDDWFVCFHMRDISYMRDRRGFGTPPIAVDARDGNIDTYRAAAEKIVAEGGKAIRMGAIVDRPIDFGPGVIDYATRYRTEFLDLYLIAKSRYFLGSSSGIYSAALAFNKYYASSNYLPYHETGYGKRTLYIPKLLRRTADGRLLTFKEMDDLGMFMVPRHRWKAYNGLEFYRSRGLEFVDSTPNEIVDLHRDITEMIEGIAPAPEARRLQSAYRALYRETPNNGEYAGWIAPRFCLRHRALFEGLEMPVEAEHGASRRRI